MPLSLPDKSYLLALGFDAAIMLIVYKFYKRNNKASSEVKSAMILDIDSELVMKLKEAEGNSIPYACIQGVTMAAGKTIKSRFVDDKEGVIHQFKMVEHKSKRMQGYWSDAKKILTDTVESVAFALFNPFQTDHKVYVDDVSQAQYLYDDLSVTHDKYKPSQSGLLQRGVDRLFGDVTKGIQETEQMLLVGTPLLGVGELMLVGGKVHLMPPSGGQKYILTKMSRSEILKSLETRSRSLKILGLISAFIAGGLLGVVLWKYMKRFLEFRRQTAMLREIRAARENAQNDNSDSDLSSSMCIICMEKPREIVILECGHICLCAECHNILPEQICPLCRGPITRVVPLYVS
ncbi:hypothetical protein ScPMuIL_005447 [Solemya velum]